MAEEKKHVGCIYILTNPSFPEYVKLGYATDLKERLKSLNSSETIPYAFRAYAVYEVDEALTDKELHKLIDKLNPGLRTIDEFDGKPRVKEFYEMSKEDAYGLLECIAKISGTLDRLHKVKPEGYELLDEKRALEVKKKQKRRPPFSFSELGISIGAELTYKTDTSIRVKVIDDRHVQYHGKSISLSILAQQLEGTAYPLQGPAFFIYEGKLLTKLRDSLKL